MDDSRTRVRKLSTRGYPSTSAVITYYGPEFIAKALIDWLNEREVKPHHIEPGSPWQNAYAESFNATLRRECLSQELFHTVLETRIKTEIWRVWYNKQRPHSSLGYRAPVKFKNGIRIPLLERGCPSSYRRGNRKKHVDENEQTLYLLVVQT